MYSVAHIKGMQDKEGFTPEAIIGGNEELDNPLYAKIVEDGAKKGLYENHAESFGAEHPSGEGKLKVSGYEFADGALMVGVGTEARGVGDPDFVEMMIDKDGKIDFFSVEGDNP